MKRDYAIPVGLMRDISGVLEDALKAIPYEEEDNIVSIALDDAMIEIIEKFYPVKEPGDKDLSELVVKWIKEFRTEEEKNECTSACSI